MTEEILPDLYKIEIPLPRSPLKALNSYLIKGEGRFLIIDTGMNREECLHAMHSNLEALGVDLKKTDFFITHLHADHLGLTSSLATETSRVYFSQKEADYTNDEITKTGELWKKRDAEFLSNGFPEDELQRAAEKHPGRRYSSKQHIDFYTLKEGDPLEIGDYSFRGIDTPGHTPGHMCLYEANKKILVAGDHILFDITPNITTWVEMDNALKTYLASLEKVYALDVNLVLPGHRRIMNNHRKRIRELQEHHQARLNEALSALEDGEKTAYQVAPLISWDISYKSWESFPAQQKWFAFGETLAHLHYLEAEGLIKGTTKEQRISFSLT